MTPSFARAFLAAIFVALSFAPCAAAQGAALSAQEQREARRQELFETGLEAARQRDYGAAYRYFRDSENAAGDSEARPDAIYNLALAASQLPQHELRAIAGFKAYLHEVPEAENAAAVNREIRRLQIAFERRASQMLTMLEQAAPTDSISGEQMIVFEDEVVAWYIVAGRLYLGQRDEALGDYNNFVAEYRPLASSTITYGPLLDAFASYRLGSAAPSNLRDALGLFEYQIEAGQLDAAQRNVRQRWFQLGCAAQDHGNQQIRAAAAAQLAANPQEQQEMYRANLVSSLASLGEPATARALVEQWADPRYERAIARTDLCRANSYWNTPSGRFGYLRRVALDGVRYNNEPNADLRLVETLDAQRSGLTSAVQAYNRWGITPRENAIGQVAAPLVEVLRVYRHVHGSF